LRIGVICEYLGALTTARASEFWICWSYPSAFYCTLNTHYRIVSYRIV